MISPSGHRLGELGQRHPGVARESRNQGVIDAVEQLAPDGFTDIEKVLSHAQREAIVRGYASKAGFAAPTLG